MSGAVPRFAGGSHTARTLALQVLLDCSQKEGFIQEHLDRRLATHPLSSPERRFATQLCYGVLRRRGTLDALLIPFLKRQPDRVEPWLWEILRLGACQLVLLSQVPAHAALYETVELATRFQRARAKGFINGVLRALAQIVTEERADNPAGDAVPMEGGWHRKLHRQVFSAPDTHPVDYLAQAFALPRWLVGRWLPRYGWEECLRLGVWFMSPAPLWLRCNPLRTTREAFLDALRQANIAAEPGEHPQSVRLIEFMTIRDLPGYAEGWFTVQDASAMCVASALAPAPGNSVLDVCAAPGGKTSHLGELMNNQGRVLACDVDDGRLQTVSDLCRRLGIDIVQTHRLHPDKNEEPPTGPFDAILVDVPCSNTGVLGRRPEIRWRMRPKDLAALVPVQTNLLHQACERVRPGGTIVYSTCSIEPEENRQVVDKVLARFSLVLEAEQNRVPGRPADGGYWARLRRQSFEQ
jgi:16S rRNA (cytosine967-C5)-methyltransferase